VPFVRHTSGDVTDRSIGAKILKKVAHAAMDAAVTVEWRVPD